MEIGTFEDLFKIRILSLKLLDAHQTVVHHNLGCPFGAFNCLVVFQNLFFPFNPLFSPKI